MNGLTKYYTVAMPRHHQYIPRLSFAKRTTAQWQGHTEHYQVRTTRTMQKTHCYPNRSDLMVQVHWVTFRTIIPNQRNRGATMATELSNAVVAGIILFSTCIEKKKHFIWPDPDWHIYTEQGLPSALPVYFYFRHPKAYLRLEKKDSGTHRKQLYKRWKATCIGRLNGYHTMSKQRINEISTDNCTTTVHRFLNLENHLSPHMPTRHPFTRLRILF